MIGPCAQLGGPGDRVPWLQGMQVSKIISDPAVVTRNTAVAVPDTSAREMTGPFRQSAAVCPFVDLGRQADGRDLECPQVSAGVVEITGDGGIADVLARTAPISCVKT